MRVPCQEADGPARDWAGRQARPYQTRPPSRCSTSVAGDDMPGVPGKPPEAWLLVTPFEGVRALEARLPPRVGLLQPRCCPVAPRCSRVTALLQHCRRFAAALVQPCCSPVAALSQLCCCLVAALLQSCCSSAAVLLQSCCSSVAALLHSCCSSVAALLQLCCSPVAARDELHPTGDGRDGCSVLACHRRAEIALFSL